MGYESFFDAMDYGLSAALGVVIAVFLVFYLVILGLSVASYILMARGMQVIAKRRGIRNDWLAWIPVAQLWTLGSISDQYQYVVKGRVRNRRKVLLWLYIADVCAMIAVEVMNILLLLGDADRVTAFTVLTVLGTFAVCLLSVVVGVFQFLALYDLYVSCDPGNGVLYLVLSIVFSMIMPLFVFLCRNKDGGMPARRVSRPAPQVIPAPVPEAVSAAEPASEAPAEEPAPETAPAAEAEAAPEPAAEEAPTEAAAEEENSISSENE